ncbi:MAG: SH3 domain-containing protein, partial [Chloroflexi bacterium]|nr:SH3 domain-containing protein [Chloroflexota bacterium]
MAYLIGPDVSFYQDDPETPQGIDFVKMRKSAGYVIIRAGQNLWVDSDFKINWREAKLAGLPRGSYWFYDSRAEPKKQAELWVEQFNGDFGELPLFADFEESYNGTYKGWKNWYAFLERLKQLIGSKEIGIYTAYYYWRDNAPNATTQAASLDYFKQYPLWIAHYGAVEPLVPAPWKKGEWLFWQYTETGDGKLYGVESKGIDLNYFNGDVETFRARFNLSDSPIPNPEPEPLPGDDTPTGIKYLVIAQPSLKVRQGPGTSYDAIGLLYPDEVVEEINANSDRTWLKVRKADNTLIGWSFSAYLKKVETTPTPSKIKRYRVTASPSLKAREGPGLDYNSLGTYPYGSIVHELAANADRTWLKVKNEAGTLIGWSFAEYLKFIDEISVEPTPNPEPEPEPQPEPEPPAGLKIYLVTASPSLKVREGPGQNYAQIGSLPLNTKVVELDANANRSWLKVKTLDGSLSGWSSADYLAFTGETAPPQDTETGKHYRVTTTSLQALQSPSSNAPLVGFVYFGQIVEELSATADRVWLKIKNADGSVVGWSLSKDLLRVDEQPAPPPDDSATPVPDDDDKKWYRVKASSAVVRETPSAAGKALGTIMLDDTLPALDDSGNPNWIQIRRVDGLEGWCEKKNFSLLSATRPSSIKQSLFRGVTFLQKDLTSPRKNRMYVIAIDLTTSGLEFLVTPSKSLNGVICTRTTSKFLEEFKLGAAINGDGYSYLDPVSYPPSTSCPTGGDPVKVNGYAASRGTVYSPTKTVQPIVYLSAKNQITVNETPSKTFNAVSGDRLVVQKGAVVKNLAALSPAPRTAVGISKNGRWLIWMVVDGRQQGYSEGVTLDELGSLLLTYGVYTGVNMDGGGSSAMVIRGVDGKARILNSPIDQNIPGKERAVANHLGLLV